MTKPHILICDDEASLRHMVAEYLGERGYDCSEAGDAAALHAQIASRRPDLVILDLRMPGEDGLSALRVMRSQSDGPAVIMLTAVSDTVDRIVGLELGADDYLGKPVDLRELDARIKAVLRRRSAPVSEAIVEKTERIGFGEMTLDLDSARLFGADGAEIEITAMEFELLKVFLNNRNRVLNRDQLLDQAHQRGWEPFDRSIDLRISRLRRKIEPDPAKPRFIKTVRGIGYMFADA